MKKEVYNRISQGSAKPAGDGEALHFKRLERRIFGLDSGFLPVGVLLEDLVHFDLHHIPFSGILNNLVNFFEGWQS